MSSTLQFVKLLEPGKIGQMAVRNRMVMPPMATRLHSEEGYVNQRTKDYYEARSKGGIGLIIVEATTIDSPEGKGFNNQLIIDDDKFIPGMRELTEVIHRHGAKTALQLHHIGPQGNSTITKHQPVAPSPIATRGGEMARPLTEADIARLVTCYALAAGRAKKAGFDGVEVHSAHGYLLAAFLHPAINFRQDRYGGSTENRARFLIEILKAIRQEVGREYPLWCRINSEVIIEYSRIIEEAGVNALHISAPTSRGDPAIPPAGERPGPLLSVAEALKMVVSVPIIVSHRIEPIQLAESALRDGKADFIAFGRAVLADPELPNKVASGRLEDVKPCLRCNACFQGMATRPEGIHCSVNPALSREREYNITKAPRSKKVIIIGGGPAGMEAARVASMRGHRVKLYEKDKKLGGQLLLAQLPRYKQTIGDLVHYLSGQMDKQGVELHRATEVTDDLITKEAPDAVVLATGASPFIPDIPGIKRDNVVLAGDVLTGSVKVGDRVVIIGGELVGCEVGDLLAYAGKEVTLTTLESDLLTFDVSAVTRESLLYRLHSMGVVILTGVQYKKITGDSVILVDKEGKEQAIKADTIVLAAGTRPNSELALLLKKRVSEVYSVGDCVTPRKILDAMNEGYRAGLSL